MPASLLESQLATLEEPDPIVEPCLTVDGTDTPGKSSKNITGAGRLDIELLETIKGMNIQCKGVPEHFSHRPASF